MKPRARGARLLLRAGVGMIAGGFVLHVAALVADVEWLPVYVAGAVGVRVALAGGVALLAGAALAGPHGWGGGGEV